MIDLLAEKLHRRLPGLSDMGLTKGWVGLYAMTIDDQVVLGPWRGGPTLIEATGGGGFGLQISPAVGRIAAQWAMGGGRRALVTRPGSRPAGSIVTGHGGLTSNTNCLE